MFACFTQSYNMPRLYSEVMRACLITLNDALGMSIESQWGAFTFLKVPHILRQLHFTIRGKQIRYTLILKKGILLKSVGHVSLWSA
jgi:hypothetical protein